MAAIGRKPSPAGPANGTRSDSGIVSRRDRQYLGCGVEAGTPLDTRPSSAPLAQRGVRIARTGPVQPSFRFWTLRRRHSGRRSYPGADMQGVKSYRVAIVWRGGRQVRREATPQNNRFYRIFEEL